MHRLIRFFCLLFAALSLQAQLIPAGSPVPRRAKPPVVFLNGYQNLCGSPFSNTFGIADQILEANGEVSIFFDNCTVAGSPAIETLGAAFGDFLAKLRYDDGQPVDTVDVVAHSMGGLIVRSYLSGKQTDGTFRPPPTVPIRKLVFLGTPHFGTGVALGLGFNAQLTELASGSRFLFDLATWNQGSDDLRGVDAIAAIGNGGTGLAVMPLFDDGVVALTSASLQFVAPGRTRILPYCHVNGGGLVSFARLCAANAPGIASIRSATQDLARLLISFFNGDSGWQNIGTAPEQDQFLAANTGLDVMTRAADDTVLSPAKVTASKPGFSKNLNLPPAMVAYTDLFPAGPATITADALSRNLNLPAGGTVPVLVKAGPLMTRVLPSAAAVFPLSLAPGELVSIYGQSLSGAQVLLNDAPLTISYNSATQVNVLLPETAPGLQKLTLRNATGSHTINVLIENAVPALFTQDGSGGGIVSALNAGNQSLVTASNPLRAGDYVELFLTGLGATTTRDALQFAKQIPAVSIGGVNCPVTFAGRAPGFPGLDQINCVVPAGVSAGLADVTVAAGSRISNSVRLPLQ